MRKKPQAKPKIRTAPASKPPKRDLFTELMEGLKSLEEERLGKRTLRTHVVDLGETR